MRSTLTVAVDKGRIAGDSMYKYRPRETTIDTLFINIAVDAFDVS
jgi:hypothetical protein